MRKILVLDDNRDILEAVAFVLSKHQIDVITLEEPSQLQNYLCMHSPDLLLMDIALGNFDGRILCRNIKRFAADTAIPVILFSARNYSAASITQSLADDIIWKPFSIKELWGSIHRLLSAA